MMRTVTIAAAAMAALATLLAASPATTPQAPTASVQRLAWMAGCWENVKGEARIEEQWMRPGGGTMLGMSRTVVRGKTVQFESMRIAEEGGRLVFTAKPSGQNEASFPSIEVTDTQVVFADPEHDFPQRILYRREKDGSLYAHIQGKMGTEMKMVEFPMSRAKCD